MRRTAVAIAISLVSVACGSPSGDVPRASSSQSSTPDEPVSHTPDPNEPIPSPTPSRVEPRPGQVDVHTVRWESYEKKGPREIEIVYWSGVEPCNVLDRVEVEETARKVTVTLYEGRTPSDEDVACIEIALQKGVLIELDAPLGGRKVVDGAPGD